MGTRLNAIRNSASQKDHPHAYGDKQKFVLLWKHRIGSSPCVWGQDVEYVNNETSLRIIPMRVGTRFKSCISYSLRQDHPHACGDKRLSVSSYQGGKGSSPCVWGQDKNGNLVPVSAEIIPMRVGTSITTGLRLMLTEDHPHACGDKPVFVTVLSLVVGSSPCVWGQDCRYQVCRLLNRIIPMRVGTRTAIVQLISSLGDHPHACGDKLCTRRH